jgi:hypothetical protein
MPAKRLKVDLDMIVQALDDHTGMVDWYLDTQTGEVCPVPEEWASMAEEDADECDVPAGDANREELEFARKILRNDDERYLYIEPGSTRDSYQVMEEFIPRVRDPRLRERLADAIGGKGAFRRFKDVLLSAPKVREEWFAFEANVKREWAREWLASVGIEAAEAEPGDAGAPRRHDDSDD